MITDQEVRFLDILKSIKVEKGVGDEVWRRPWRRNPFIHITALCEHLHSLGWALDYGFEIHMVCAVNNLLGGNRKEKRI